MRMLYDITKTDIRHVYKEYYGHEEAGKSAS